jgi:hypothetical protein
MGPQASKSYPGQRLVRASAGERAPQEIDYGRRGIAGYVFGAFQPATGAALTMTYEGRTTANWIDFLCRVEGWIDPTAERIYAVMEGPALSGVEGAPVRCLGRDRTRGRTRH